ncbi:hypothetical protein [Enterobacter phage 04_vB_Eclo_IJM]|nr:hypothetical protein [Enterobacter phage 04_vB_Eclo_IJM]
MDTLHVVYWAGLLALSYCTRSVGQTVLSTESNR